MTMSGTSNTTSFARDALAATALILDAFAVSGSDRRIKLTEAQNLIDSSISAAYSHEELALGNALNDVIKDCERNGLGG